MCIWALSVMIFEELSHSPLVPLIKEIVKTILPFCDHENANVARAALDSLSTIALVFEDLRKVDEPIISIIIEMLSNNILRMILENKAGKPSPLRESLVADHFYCLLDWIMGSTVYLFDKQLLASKVFEAIEFGLLGQKFLPDQQKEIGGVVDIKGSKKKRASVTKEVMASEMLDQLEQLKLKPVHGSETIKEAAGILLVQLCNFLQNFPSPEGIEIISSQIGEDDDISVPQCEPLFYIYNDFALFSCIEVPKENESVARIILRDSTGKYAWDSTINYNNFTNAIEPAVALLCEPIHRPPVIDAPVESQSNRLASHIPVPSEQGPPVDQLDDLLQYLGEVYPDCLPEDKTPLHVPRPANVESEKAVREFQEALLSQERSDNEVVSVVRETNSQWTDEYSFRQPPPAVPQSPLHFCRLLLSHLGLLAYDKQASFSMVENSQRFTRTLLQLDKLSGREMSKIGVIYVREGQDDQKVIFRNDQKSPLYAEFVRGLGWPIDIANHRGYLGGLDPKLTTGTHAPYFANSIMEVVFHEITSMPTVEADPQQIHKKRHVGNDIVHIVYSEHSSDYLPTTITSQFNDAHVVVYPLPNGLFRVQVHRKEHVNLFGPLIHGMCVNKQLLPTLVRQTAINANRYVRYSTEGYTRPFPTRRKALDETVERFKVETPYEDLIGELLPKVNPTAITAKK